MKSQNDSSLILKKGDLIIITAVLLVAGIAVLLIMHQKQGDRILVTSNGSTVSYALNVDRKVEIKGDLRGYNLLIISDGRAWMEEADCKNQICVHHKPIYKNHESIACLPNKVFVEVVGSTPNEIDN